jgi:peptidoglycan/LPS O-acetylase OafA/YrhL
MTLFFILSGFVIHLNYNGTAPIGSGGTGTFFIARFARLYPLFLVMFCESMFEVLWSKGYTSGQPIDSFDVLKAVPLYLTFTESWWLWPLGPNSAYEYYREGSAGLMWSLSVEALFYVLYPFVASRITRLRARSLVISIALVTIAGLAYFLLALHFHGELYAAGAKAFPNVPHGSLFHWIIYVSPWGRLSEFLLGALAAQLYMTGQRAPHGAVTTYAVLGLVITALGLSHAYGGSFLSIDTSCFALGIAATIYLLASSDTALSRFFANPLIVAGGAASYSLYLLHHLIVHTAATHYSYLAPPAVIMIASMTVAILVAQLSYVFFERPMIKWVRRNFRQLRLDVAVPSTIAGVSLICIVGSMTATALQHSVASPAPGKITVLTASFGDNCKPELKDNVLAATRQVCGGTEACSFVYDVEKYGDPAGGCDKRFAVSYTCGPGTPEERFSTMFSRVAMPVSLSCRR